MGGDNCKWFNDGKEPKVKACFCIGAQRGNTKCPCELERDAYKKQSILDEMNTKTE